jgi:ubiquinone/menaquinone biosynthesis C-methylase UbiE
VVIEVFDYDAELVHYNARLQAEADVATDDRVLDIGCGAGQTTRGAAAAASSGSAMGIDVSVSMIDLARQLSNEAGLCNATYTRGDAQLYSFIREHFTLAISRFGTMFFTDPSSAFVNIASALRPGARLV